MFSNSTQKCEKLNSLLVANIKSFLEIYRKEPKKKFTPSNSGAVEDAGQRPYVNQHNLDPTTANAFNTSTVVIMRKKNNRLKNSPFDGVQLPNYRLRQIDVRREVFDWVAHFLWLKNCPVELATIIASKIADRMNTETAKQMDNSSPHSSDSPSELCPVLASPSQSTTFSTTLEYPSLDQVDSTSPRSSLPSALCSIDVARQSRTMVDEYVEELGSNPDTAIELVTDYLDNSSATKSQNGIVTVPFNSSVCAVKNGRKSMEDRHIIIHDLNKVLGLKLAKQYSYYAIFDGHAGVDAASYSTAHLHHNLVSSEAFVQGRIEDAFREAFEITDSLYIQRCEKDGVDQLKPSGTTALCALIEDNQTVYLAWVGDSQAVLVRNGVHEEIMLPHKPDLDSERTRIQDLGGLVVFIDTWRVNGVLSVTRAIGDPDHKPYVIAEPSLAKFNIDSSLDFLVLGCDGLFDQLSSQDIAAHVFEFLCKNENRDPQETIVNVSAYLSEMAVKEGSNDNITSIVLFFKPFEQLVATGFSSANETLLPVERPQSDSSTLPATNGGHFPYTDFSELPIGANFNLHSMPQLVNPPEEGTPSSGQNPFEDIQGKQNADFDDDGYINKCQLENPLIFEDNNEQQAAPSAQRTDLFSDELSTEESIESKPNLQPKSSELFATQDTAQSFAIIEASAPEPSPVLIENDPHEVQLHSSVVAINPFTMETIESAAQMNDHQDNFDSSHASPEQNMNASAANQSLPADEWITTDHSVDKPLLTTFSTEVSAENPFVESAQSIPFLHDLAAPAVGVSLSKLENTSLDFKPEAEQSVQSEISESLLDNVQHRSDSGYCYTNSLSEFSTSFPSENKLEDNLCSTPLQPELPTANESESGLIDTVHMESNLLHEDTLNENQNVEAAVNAMENSINNWQNSLQNNSLLEDTSETKETEPIKSDFQISTQQNFTDVIALESTGESVLEPTFEPTPPLFTPEPLPSDISAFTTVTELQDQQPSKQLDVFVNQLEVIDVAQSAKENYAAELNQQLNISGIVEEAIVSDSFPQNSANQSDLVDLTSDSLPAELVALESSPLATNDTVEETAKELENEIQPVASSLAAPLLTEEIKESQTAVDKFQESKEKGSLKENGLKETTKSGLSKPKTGISSATVPKKPSIGTTSQLKSKLTATTKTTTASSGTTKPVASRLIATAKSSTTAASKQTNNATKPLTSSTRTTSTITAKSSLTNKALPSSSGIARKTTVQASSSSRIGNVSKPSVATAKSSTTTKTTTTTRNPVTKATSSIKLPATTTRTTSSTIQRNAAVSKLPSPKPKPVEVKPTVPVTRKSLPASMKPVASSTLQKTSVLSSRATTARSTATSTRPATSVSTATSKVGSFRTASSTSTLKPQTSRSNTSAVSRPLKTTSTSTLKPANGASTTGIKVVKKPSTVPSATPKLNDSVGIIEESSVQLNGTTGISKGTPVYSSKRSIGVENSLKQELEEAVNGLNGGASNDNDENRSSILDHH